MGKKKKNKNQSSVFDYHFRTGKVGKMMDRYDVEEAKSYHPDGRSMGRTGSRSIDEINSDLAAAMMADPNTVMQFHYGADVDKGAKKIAKKGITGKNVYDAYGTLERLKHKFVGGGGMNGPENIMGLTNELKNASRNAWAAELAEREPKMEIPEEDPFVENPYEDEPEGLDPFVKTTRDRVDEWIRDGSGRTGRGYAGVFPLGRYDGQKGEIVPSPGNEGLDATEERIMDGPSFASDFKRKLMDDLRQAAGYDSTYA